ncbi:excinuclease ABC subunit UvrA [Fontisphaera persica]|nr:excinuclease ABC subunit UvrA [Fontisphaera persica]WCJ60868.1 excinuclease ABC subunit UvrA [Fontisphaera persica]
MASKSGPSCIRLRGVRHNNLKNFDLDLPLGRLVVITGLSGSGKSSLAFDTLFAEGQRRYIETFSPYARQFFDRMDKPAVDSIEGIPPAIAIEQRNTVRSTRSTVGTMTELCELLKQLWPHLAQLHCSGCGQPVRREPPEIVWEIISAHWPDQEVLVTFDLPLTAKLSLKECLHLIQRQGYRRLLIEGQIVEIDQASPGWQSSHPASVTVIQDRLRLSPAHRSRAVEACEQAYHFGHGRLRVWPLREGRPAPGEARSFSLHWHCAPCNLAYPPPVPSLFSFNHPAGACPACKGFGRIITVDYRRALPDPSKTLKEGAIKPWQSGMSRECQDDLMTFCKKRGVPVNVPFRDLPPDIQKWVIEGDPDYGKDAAHQWPHCWYGLRGYFRWLESKTYKMHVRVLLSRYRTYTLCPSCNGTRLKPEALNYRLPPPCPPLTLPAFHRLTLQEALQVAMQLRQAHSWESHHPLAVVLDEVCARLGYLVEVGLGYLTLDRPTRTLSGGETERVNLATCLGTRLVNTLFVLDEPSVGLHPRDTHRLVKLLQRLRDAGNTVVVVEHEPLIIQAADQVVDLGPGHGAEGGHLVFQGSLSELQQCPPSLTGAYLSGRRQIPLPVRRMVKDEDPRLVIRHANAHNLKDLTVEIPLGRFVALTGVSGSGKTTLLRDVLLPLLAARFTGLTVETSKDTETAEDEPGDWENEPEPASAATLEGAEALGHVVWVDQSPIGRTPRSNPALYTGAFEALREFFAQLPMAASAGLKASDFSFNSARGQCAYCRGAGFEKVEMQFLSDVFIRCPACQGRRYRSEVLNITFSDPQSPARSYSIADVLEASVEEVQALMERFPDSAPARRAAAALQVLQDVGLGYLRLGQPINTLSGGECQRLKLARHLAEFSMATHPASSQPTLFLFDEPTTGLHWEDVRVLLEVFKKLVDQGHSLLVIEHNLEVIKAADWLIDLGPEAGAEGGRIVICGPPEIVAGCEASHTGAALRADTQFAQHWRTASSPVA